MDWPEILLFVAALLVMIIGLAGVILPVLPGIPIIFAAALIYGFLTGFSVIGADTLLIFAILTIIALILDWAAGVVGVRKMGGSRAGMIGAFLGMIIGLLLPGVGIAGFIIGAFAGAFIMELLVNRDSRIALRAGFGSFLGFLAGGLAKFVIGSIMIGMFIWRVIRG
jgi:uncharacterized protein YqgC (DUF456 family)